MKRVGEVTAVRGDKLEITFCRPADCGKCHACGGNREQMSILIAGEAQLGDAAVVDMPDSTVMQASLMAYVLPCAGLLGGLALGSTLGKGDMMGVVGGAIGLAVTLAIVAVSERKRRSDERWQPKLVQILPGAGDAAKTPADE